MARSQVNIEDLTDDKDDAPARKSASSSKSRPSRSAAKQEADLRERLVECFDRIAGALRTRGDEELAELIDEDAEVMAVGLVSMTRPLQVLRAPLLVVVAVVEPLLAFGRIGRVLLVRFAERRAIAQMQAEAAQQDADGEPQPA